VGGTPLVRLRRIAQGPVEVHVKCEWMNPAGSVKDRPALWMIRDAEDRACCWTGGVGCSTPRSGNTGIALAQLAAAPRSPSDIDYAVECKPGAQTVALPAGRGTHSDRRAGRERRSADGRPADGRRAAGSLCFLDQYSNPMNWKAHYESTAPEIWRQTERTHHAFRRHHGYQRDVHRRGPTATGVQSWYPTYCRPT